MDRQAAWMMIYSGIVAFQNHPRNEAPKSPSECAELADLYLAECVRRVPLWDGLQQE